MQKLIATSNAYNAANTYQITEINSWIKILLFLQSYIEIEKP